ncbi:MAG: MtrB/PioB family outer membrane beta-barrel protein [Deltaproteobacteria bacterium]|nr:MtrB/PioB family outer membrane beta-barrel protein [Deltaproteobacteria bacterium]
MYKIICSFFVILVFLLTVGLMPVMAGEEEGRIETSGDIKVGAQQIGNNKTNSSKFNEYRDIKDGFYLYKFNLEGIDTQTGRYLEFRGKDLIRDDQNIILRLGSYGTWGLEIEWDETPHLLSNKAKTPYNYQGNGLYTVPATAGVDMTTAGASTTKDTTVSNYLNSYLHSTDLGTQREKGRVALTYTPSPQLKFKLEYSDERKEGTQITGTPIGDRPPRTMNTQIPEPVDYHTRDLRFDAEYAGEWYQVQFSYLLSDFENDVTSLTWQSLFYNPTAGNYTTVEDGTTDRTYSTYGRIALYPENRYQNVALSFGVNLPLDSRLTATASYGLMEQDEDLLPYSYSTLTTNWDSTSRLPRQKADAEIETTMFNVDYTINPIDRLNLRAFYRYYNLDNNTKTDEWYYVTSDASSNTAGGTAVNNQRKNLAYGYKKQNFGLD